MQVMARRYRLTAMAKRQPCPLAPSLFAAGLPPSGSPARLAFQMSQLGVARGSSEALFEVSARLSYPRRAISPWRKGPGRMPKRNAYATIFLKKQAVVSRSATLEHDQ